MLNNFFENSAKTDTFRDVDEKLSTSKMEKIGENLQYKFMDHNKKQLEKSSSHSKLNSTNMQLSDRNYDN